jgi:hypothetical protein
VSTAIGLEILCAIDKASQDATVRGMMASWV